MPGYIRQITDPRELVCNHWQGPFGNVTRCPEPATVIEIARGDWTLAHPRCQEHTTGDPQEYLQASLSEATGVQIRMAGVQLLQDLAHSRSGEDGPRTGENLGAGITYRVAAGLLSKL